MDRSQKQFVEDRISSVNRRKGDQLYRKVRQPKSVKRARTIVRRHESLVARNVKRSRKKLATAIAKCRRVLVFGSPKQALVMIDAVARRKF